MTAAAGPREAIRTPEVGSHVAVLASRTVAWPTEIDALTLAGRDGLVFTHPRGSLAGIGRALRIPLPIAPPAVAAAAVTTALATIHVARDEIRAPGSGPIAFGALAFSSSSSAHPITELVVPEIAVGRTEDGRAWLTTITREDEGSARHDAIVQALLAGNVPGVSDAVESTVRGPAGDRSNGDDTEAVDPDDGSFRVDPVLPPAVWCDRVDTAVARLRAGDLRKVVLAREVTVRAGGRIDRGAVLERLRDTYPGCMLFAVDGFVGASPELLVARHGDRVRSHPLAGTAPRSADAVTDDRLAAELAASPKNREEHRITIDMVHDTLLPYCSYLDEEAEPSIVPMANVQHLGTMVEGQLSSPPPSVLELALALHPTPAVGGWPVAPALAVIAELEGIDRGRYAGPVGWVDAAGNGEWAVGIRSAELAPDRRSARVFAGVGIVADSDPESELAETRAKFQAMLSALVRP